MILKVLKSNRISNYFLVLLLGIISWSDSLCDPLIYPYNRGESENLLYKIIDHLLKDSSFIQSLAGLVVILFLAFLIQQINSNYNIISSRTFLPSFIFIIITGGLTGIHSLHPVYIATIFLLISLYRLFNGLNKSKPYSAAFDTGFLLAVAALFYFNILILLPAFFIGIGIMARDKCWRNYLLIIIGFLLPFFFAFSYTIVNDQFLELIKTYEYNIFNINNKLQGNISLQLFLGFLTLLVLLGSIKIISQFDIKKVSTRKFFTIFFLIFLSSVAGILFMPGSSQEMLIIIAIPVTFLLSDYLFYLKNRLWGEILLSSLLTFVIILQIIA
jgi:hypothetical protein